MKILHKDCNKNLAENRGLPRNSYLVSYLNNEDIQCYDIVQESSKIKIFDYYWDTYRNIKSIQWTKGTVNPRLSDYKQKKK